MPRPEWAGRVATVTSAGEWRSAPWVPRAEFGDPRADCRGETSALGSLPVRDDQARAGGALRLATRTRSHAGPDRGDRTSGVTMMWYFAFFVASGFCSLVYQVVWLRLVMAAFGVTTPLVALVLSVFMAGLAIGSWAAGRLASGRAARRSVAAFLGLYAIAEIAIGAAGLLVPIELEGAGRCWAGSMPVSPGVRPRTTRAAQRRPRRPCSLSLRPGA